jgi:hypothetical protein
MPFRLKAELVFDILRDIRGPVDHDWEVDKLCGWLR